jgi:hypothetical protein
MDSKNYGEETETLQEWRPEHKAESTISQSLRIKGESLLKYL